MKISKTSLKTVRVTYEEYIEWAINNHLNPSKKETVSLFFKLIKEDKLVRDKYTNKLRRRQSQVKS